MNAKFLLYPALLLMLGSKCKQNDPVPPPPTADPLATLPPETQTGAGTMGCLINGKAYMAPSAFFTRAELQSFTTLGVSGDVYADGDRANGGRSIVIGLSGQLQSAQKFGIISSASSSFPFFTPGVNQFFVSSGGSTCSYGKFFKTGQVELVAYDPVARVVAGRFAFTLYEPGCDTLRVTNGRFDVKF